MKKLLGLCLVLILFVGLVPISFSACGKKSSLVEEEQLSEEDVAAAALFSFVKTTVDGEVGYSVFRYKGNLANVSIPSSFMGLPVHEISDSAFQKKSISSVVIPDSVVIVEKKAFYQCLKLKSVSLSNNLKIVERYTFENCIALESIVIPDSVVNIEFDAFNACVCLKTVSIGSSVKSIGTFTGENSYGPYGSFGLCVSLENFDFGDSVVEYKDEFWGGYSLKSIRFGFGITSIIGRSGSSYHFSGDANFDLRDYVEINTMVFVPVIEKIVLTTSVTTIDPYFFINTLSDTRNQTAESYVFNKIVIEGDDVDQVLRVFELILDTEHSDIVRQHVSIGVKNQEIADALSAVNTELSGGGFEAIFVAD